MPAAKANVKTEDIVRMRLNGVHPSVIAATFGISKTTVYERLHKANMRSIISSPKKSVKICECCGIRTVPPNHRKLCSRCFSNGVTVFEDPLMVH